ncbi:predicted protein [Sclerotinia sclerotiorum 1980 UF-70]|uniref:Uncharacterized protein n=2 Tax=Sclerotinia sclerotiorum (strain ATCC 18683 / 1980 / Ss-1) TaxID=665079 RepID=A7EP12_SCLS1|nr:predicted protein [Sclerotinia sclerotiorum 1980 UF-70]APA10444.1 hypothetical protein sscle_06g052140 [Sclerotinia sclerotiorum 1980 UF-70]EDO04578.1 predicted protein [Sclerotinia sclerotiorum 1980 UF-70]
MGADRPSWWRLSLIVENCITAPVAIPIYPFIPAWPHQAKWLSDKERTSLADIIKKEDFLNRRMRSQIVTRSLSLKIGRHTYGEYLDLMAILG